MNMPSCNRGYRIHEESEILKETEYQQVYHHCEQQISPAGASILLLIMNLNSHEVVEERTVQHQE